MPTNTPPSPGTVARRPRIAIGCLLLNSALLAMASLILLPAPTYPIWLLSVAVREWGHWLALVALLLLLVGWRTARRRIWLPFVLPLLALLLLSLPVLQALPIAAALPSRLTTAFGPTPLPTRTSVAARPQPLVLFDLWRGIPLPPVREERVTYVMRDGQPLVLDLWLPLAAQPTPGVLVVHGGGWQSGDSTQLADLNRYLAARGYVVAALTYRLAPEHPFPAAREDVQAALTYLRAHATEIGLDAERLVLVGRSAGGQLALLVAYTTNDPAIRGVVALYSPTDLSFGYHYPTNPAVLDSRELLEAYLGGTLAEVPAIYEAASPITFVTPDTPPTLLIHGARDDLVFVAHSERLAARLAGAEVAHLFLRLPWATHGCDANLNGPCGQLSTYAIEHFLAAVTTNPPNVPN